MDQQFHVHVIDSHSQMTQEMTSFGQQYWDKFLLILKKMQFKAKIYFLESHWENSDTFLRLKEIYLNIVGQMMSFLESFENVNQERGHEIVDQTNVPV